MSGPADPERKSRRADASVPDCLRHRRAARRRWPPQCDAALGMVEVGWPVGVAAGGVRRRRPPDGVRRRGRIGY
ncbi:hypothetical protein G6F63_014927 [Rhizopus arrhizus]|nr:hypothetical protein G6F63_014927 [Rhizopus arrhizus]